MRNKKLAMLLLATVMVASTATATATLTSCGDKPPVTSSTPVDDVSISLNETATISEFDKLKLTATVVGEGDVVWTTSDPSIVTVEDGTIYGVKAGTATVTATIGEKSASCQVTVTATPYAHELVLSSQTVTLTEEGTNEVEVSVKFNGKPLTVDGVVYTWKPVDNAEEVATVTTTDNGAKATFTGLKVGEVTYEVSATVRGYEVTKLVTVNVVEAILALNMENEAFTSGENGLEVALTLGDAATESLTIGKVNLYRNGENKGETDVTWKMADGEFATVENGVITAKKAGTTTLTGTAQYNGRDVSITVSVKVVKGAVELQDTTVTVEAVAGKIAIPAAVQGTVQKITIGGVVVREAEQIGVQGGQADFLKENMPTDIREYGDNKKIIIETDKVVYTIPASVYTMIIDSKEDFDQWESVACDEAVRAGLCEEAYKGDYTTGYFVLGSDIEYNALYKPTVTFMTYGTHYNWKKDWGNDANFGFKGTIDGKGHTISGITVSGRYQGLVTTLSGGTIKNLAFVDATVGEGASLIAAAGSGTIENIYVQYKKITNSTGDRVGTIYANYTMPTRVTKNVVIDITDCEFDAEIKNTILFGYTYGTVENIVIIGEFDHKSADNMVGIAYNEGIVDLDASVLAHAPTYAALLEGDLTIVDALDQDFFAKNGSILLSKYEMEKHADETPALTNEETEIEVGTSLTLSGSKYVTYALKEEVAKFSNNGGNMQYHGTSITLNTPVTVTEDMHYIKVRLYVQSTDLQTYALRFYRADRAAHGDGVDLDIGGLATNQWIDVYLDMARFVVNGKLESFRVASWAAGNADLYVDDITITDAKGTKVELTGAKIYAPHAGNQWGTDLTLSGTSFTLTNGVSYSNAKLVFAEPVDVTGASYINICLRKSHELDVIFFNSDNAHKDTCLGATGFGAYTVVSLPVGNYAKDGKVSSISIGAWGDVTDFTLDVAYISVV